MKRVKALSIMTVMLFILQIMSPSLGSLHDVSAEGNLENEASEKIRVILTEEEDNLLTWQVDVNLAEAEHDGIDLEIVLDESQTLHTFESEDDITPENNNNRYSFNIPTSRTHHEIILQTTFDAKSEVALTITANAVYGETIYTANASTTIEKSEAQTEAPEKIGKEIETLAETEKEPEELAQREAKSASVPTSVASADNTLAAAGDNITDLEYDESSYSKDVRKYNGIIFGNHYINGGDNEGSTAVGGNVIIEGGFDYGAAETESPNIIGSSPLHRDTPGLLLKGTVTGTGSGIGIYNGVVMTADADPNDSLLIKSGDRLFVEQAELNAVFADFRTYIDNHHAELMEFVTNSPTADLTFSDSDESERVLIANVAGPHYSVGSPNFPNVDDYDKVIIYSDARTIDFSGGAIFLENQIINTSAPFGTEPNFEKIANKVTWLFPNASTITSNGYGVIGTVVAPNANYTGIGGSLNGQLFINDLKSYGGFELHQLRNKVEVPHYGKIKITKVDSENNNLTLAGAIFKIIDEEGNVVGELVTDVHGEAVSDALLVGNYTLVEVEAPDGYDLLTEAISITVERDQVSERTIENSKTPDPLGQIKIIKVDAADDLIRLSGAKFNIINTNGEVVGELITDENGEATSDPLLVGEYTLEETEAPTDYELLTEAIPVTVIADEVIEISIKNAKIPDPLGEIKIIKVDAADHSVVLADAKFTLTDEAGNEIATDYTNDAGEIIFTDLILGKYYLTEVEAPGGYRILMQRIEFDLTKEVYEIESLIENEPIGWEIPDTGGIGTLGFYGIGLLLILTALWFVVRRRNA